MKKVVIYNRYLRTAGGGEKHMGGIAEYFSLVKKYQVDIISHEYVDLEWLSNRLNINLSKCNLIIEPTRDDLEVANISAQYDIFINTTVYSKVQPRASKNCILIFFPIQYRFYNIRSNEIFHALGKKLTNLLSRNAIQVVSGAYAKENVGEITGFWTKEKLYLKLGNNGKTSIQIDTQLFGKHDLKEAVESVSIGNDKISFSVNGNSLRFSFNNNSSQFVELKFKPFSPNNSDTRKLGVFVSSISFFEGFSNKFIGLANRFVCIQKHFELVEYLDAYDVIWTNSKYTKKWFDKIWKKKNSILYPIIDVKDFSNNVEKKNIILSVGRFFDGDHNKKHIPMIKTFRKMIDEGLEGWEYHLCGGTHKEAIHQNYLSRVKELSKGYPIYIHNDIPFEELKNRYATASVFWHAAGYGENENKHPDKFEHFGITTVEAMAAGCIPVVINKAGQKEIIENKVNGYLWDNLEDLKIKTKEIIQMSNEGKKIILKNALKKAHYYNRALFFHTLKESLNINEITQ